MTDVMEVKDGKPCKREELLPACKAAKCRGVFTHREPLKECFIFSEKDAMQLVAGTGRWLRE